ncbi:MAG TPA: class I SAM-dependent methyltransferase [Draconibacterium sp.]|nr:class I SAM-dependent methyltransferase [Draconibacterium sp.]
MKQLIKFFSDKQHLETVLDVGTGPGNFIKVLKEIFPKAKITGVDPDEESLASATEKFPDAVFRKMNGEQLGFEDNTFDVASISMVLHHLSDVKQTLVEMKRVIKPDGWLIVNELFSDDQNPAQEVHKQIHHFRSKIDRMNGIIHNPAFTRKQIVEQIEGSGLNIVLKFEFSNPKEEISEEDIAERKSKLWTALESMEVRDEYEELKAEIPIIEAALDQHGFEMSSRLVCVAQSKK